MTTFVTYTRSSVRPASGFHSVAKVPLQQIIWNLYTTLGTIKGMPSSILNIATFSVLELCQCLLEVGASITYEHILSFFILNECWMKSLNNEWYNWNDK